MRRVFYRKLVFRAVASSTRHDTQQIHQIRTHCVPDWQIAYALRQRFMNRVMRTRTQRTGLRIRGSRGNPKARAALIRFARWLRMHYEFPIRVPVYLYPSKTIITMHGDLVVSSLFAPWSRKEEPFIRIATGDYQYLVAERGKDNALAAFLYSLAYEVLRYHQWLATNTLTVSGAARKARRMVDAYAKTVNHP